MAASLDRLMTYIRHLAARSCKDPDAMLVERYARGDDELAFAALVARHGAMVYNTCRRIVCDAHLAEDAFQATFLVLARKAGRLRDAESVAAWLYGVAHRLACKARSVQRRGPRTENIDSGPEPAAPVRDPLAEMTARELLAVVEAEVQQLPEGQRLAVVLCCLDGLSREEAAQRLGLTEGAVKGLLERGRARLQSRLTRKGLTLAAALATAEATRGHAVGGLAALVSRTAAGAAAYVQGQQAASISAEAFRLAQFALKGSLMFKVSLFLMVPLGAAAVGVGGLTQFRESDVGKAPTAAAATPLPAQTKAPAPKLDGYEDPLPPGALARLGTTRFRTADQLQFAYSPNGAFMATCTAFSDGPSTVHIREASTGKALHRLSVQNSGHLLAFSSDSKTLITENSLIDVATGKEIRQFAGRQPWLVTMACSPDGKIVAKAEHVGQRELETRVILIDVGTGKELRRFSWNGGEIKEGAGASSPNRLTFSPDGKLLATCSLDKIIRLWDVQTGKEVGRLEGHDKPVLVTAFSQNSNLLASTAHDERAILIWNWETGNLLKRIPAKTQWPVAFFSPDGTLLVADGTTARLFNVESGQELRSWSLPNRMQIAFSPDGKTVAGWNWTMSAIHRWDVSTGKEIDPPQDHVGPIVAFHFTADGKKLFSVASDRVVQEWNLSTNPIKGQRLGGPLGAITEGQYNTIADLSPSGKLVALHSTSPPNGKPMILIYDVATGESVHALPNARGGPAGIKFSPDSKLLAAVTPTELAVWDVASWKTVQQFTAAPERFTFSPDGQKLAITRGSNIRLFDVKTGQEFRSFDHSVNFLYDLMFSQDGKKLAYAATKTVGVWSVDSGKQLCSFPVAAGAVQRLTFSPSGRCLAAVAGEVIHLWDVLSQEAICDIHSDQGRLTALAFSPDGRALASGGADSTILLWDLSGQSAGQKPNADLLTPAQLEKLWSDLGNNAPKADAAIWALARAGKQAFSLLQERLRPVAPASPEIVAALVADLDSDKLTVRKEAAKQLEDLGESAELQLRKDMAGNIPLELRQRLEQILQKRDNDPEIIRRVRAIEALEQTRLKEAEKLLDLLAKEAPQKLVADAAGAALARSVKRDETADKR
jgi:RNA polymerase sigma factor (sigma-70 family)